MINLNKKKCFILSIFIIFSIMLILNYLTPLIADDFWYRTHTEGISTILRDEQIQYMQHTGRSVVHVIARFFLLMPKTVFNVVNSLAYVYLTLLIYRITRKKENERYSISRYALINIAIWLFVPVFGQVILWETGACNYLWGIIIMLTLITIYHGCYSERPVLPASWSIRASVLMLVLGVLAGWCNENTSGGTILLVVMYIFLLRKNKTKTPPPSWIYSGLIGTLIGFCAMMLAPGNFLRASASNRFTWPLSKKLLTGIFEITISLKDHALFLLLLVALLIFLALILRYEKDIVRLALGYLLSGLATIYALSVSPEAISWGRSYFGGVIFIIIALIFGFQDLSKRTEAFQRCVFGCIYIAMSVPFVLSFVIGVGDIGKSYLSIERRYQYLVQQKREGNLNPVVGRFDTANNTSYPANSNALVHIEADKSNGTNRAVAMYFGLESVVSVPEKDWKLIYLSGSSELMRIHKLTDYLKAIDDDRYTVLLSASGSIAGLEEEDLLLLESLFGDMRRGDSEFDSMVAIKDAGADSVKQDEYASEASTTVSKKKIEVLSQNSHFKELIKSSIKIDGKEFSRNKSGLNIVVLDSKTGRALDSVAFDISKKYGEGVR